jgi:hypothetical protein
MSARIGTAHVVTTTRTCNGIIRTSVESERMTAEDCVRNYKSLASVERAFRSLKTVDLKVLLCRDQRKQRRWVPPSFCAALRAVAGSTVAEQERAGTTNQSRSFFIRR